MYGVDIQMQATSWKLVFICQMESVRHVSTSSLHSEMKHVTKQDIWLFWQKCLFSPPTMKYALVDSTNAVHFARQISPLQSQGIKNHSWNWTIMDLCLQPNRTCLVYKTLFKSLPLSTAQPVAHSSLTPTSYSFSLSRWHPRMGPTPYYLLATNDKQSLLGRHIYFCTYRWS